MKIRHKIISCFLAFVLLFNCLPPLHAQNTSRNRNARLERLQQKYGSLDLNELYDIYEQVRISPEESPYFQKSYEELLTIYDQINDDISFLWSQNPEYLQAKIEKTVRNVIAGTAAVTLCAVAAYFVGSYLAVSGFPIAGELISYIPLNTSAQAPISLKSAQTSIGAIKLAKLLKGGKKIKDIAKLSQTISRTTTSAKGMLLWTTLMTADGILLTESFFALDNSLKRIQKIQDESYKKYLPNDFAISMNKFFKKANYFAPLFDDDVEKAQKIREKYLSNLTEDFDDLDNETKGPTMAEYLRIGSVITTIHVLELIRAELSNLNNPIRYDMASFDIFDYFFDNEKKQLETREELMAFLMPIHKALEQKTKDNIEKITKRFEEGDFTYSKSIL